MTATSDTRPWPEGDVPLRDSEGKLLRFLQRDSGRLMVAMGDAEPVGKGTVRYLRVKGAAARAGIVHRAAASQTVYRRGNFYGHILNAHLLEAM